MKIETKPNGQIALRPPEWRRAEDPDDDEMPIEEMIEMQRKALDLSQCTPVDADNFKAWLELKKLQKESQQVQEKKVQKKKGVVTGPTGRELFQKDASLFKDDADATDDIDYTKRVDGMCADEDKPTGAIDNALFADDAELPDDL